MSIKRILALLFCLLLFTGIAHAAQDYPDNAILTFEADIPETLRQALLSKGIPEPECVTGMLGRRFGDWDYAVMTLRMDGHYVLCCGIYLKTEQSWDLSFGGTALPQDCAPVLTCESLELGLSGDELGSWGTCGSFTARYPDADYRWISTPGNWCIVNIERADGTSIAIGTGAITWNGEFVTALCQPRDLEHFDLSAFPATPGEADLIASTAGFGDDTLGVLVLPDEGDSYGGVVPAVKMYRNPGDTKARMYLFDGIPCEVLDAQRNYVQVRVGDENGVVGWIHKDNLVTGLRRAGVYVSNGVCGQVQPDLQMPLNETRVIYRSPTEFQSDASVDVLDTLFVLGITSDDSMLLVRYSDTCYGWMPADSVAQYEVSLNAWVVSRDPANRLHMREAPRRSADSLGKYYAGTKAVLMFSHSENNEWQKIMIGGTCGWVMKSYLSYDITFDSTTYLPPIATVKGTTGGLNLRTGPSSNEGILDRFPNGTKVEILGVKSSWAHVRLKSGVCGYMMLSYLGGEPKQATLNLFQLTSTAQPTDFEGNIVTPLTRMIRLPERWAQTWHFVPTADGGYEKSFSFIDDIQVQTADGTGVFMIDQQDIQQDW